LKKAAISGLIPWYRFYWSRSIKMAKKSLWKRTYDWFRRPHKPMENAQVVPLDAEGLLIEPEELPEDEQNSALATRPNKKDRQLAAMEEGFGRLVEVLELINDNVVRQGEQSTQMNSRLAELARSLPEVTQEQKGMIRNISEQLQNQALHSSQLVETMKNLPDLHQDQVNRLGEIKGQLETSGQTTVQMAESLHQLDSSLQGVANNSKAQSASLANIGSLLEQNEANLQKIIAKQNRRFAWLIGLWVVIILAGIGALILTLKAEIPLQ